MKQATATFKVYGYFDVFKDKSEALAELNAEVKEHIDNGDLTFNYDGHGVTPLLPIQLSDCGEIHTGELDDERYWDDIIFRFDVEPYYHEGAKVSSIVYPFRFWKKGVGYEVE